MECHHCLHCYQQWSLLGSDSGPTKELKTRSGLYPRVLPLRFLDCYHNTQDIIPRPLGARGGASVSAYTASFCSILSFTVHIALVRQRLHQITGCFVLFNKDLYMNSLKTGSPVLTLEFFYSMLLSIDFIGSVLLSSVYCSLAACSCPTCTSAAI